jgi:hypothetical protein
LRRCLLQRRRHTSLPRSGRQTPSPPSQADRPAILLRGELSGGGGVDPRVRRNRVRRGGVNLELLPRHQPRAPPRRRFPAAATPSSSTACQTFLAVAASSPSAAGRAQGREALAPEAAQ